LRERERENGKIKRHGERQTDRQRTGIQMDRWTEETDRKTDRMVKEKEKYTPKDRIGKR
jgi:hypothetical protein